MRLLDWLSSYRMRALLQSELVQYIFGWIFFTKELQYTGSIHIFTWSPYLKRFEHCLVFKKSHAVSNKQLLQGTFYNIFIVIANTWAWKLMLKSICFIGKIKEMGTRNCSYWLHLRQCCMFNTVKWIKHGCILYIKHDSVTTFSKQPYPNIFI